ncbi:hypothetical protein N7533_003630 [Penicillium manginii]|uniref:uncharacterized protein n=1 Tax=Penicillium manginii TaxID=203109 RepID=UPI002546DDC2|nr:uncharacterized protein N7533_003630 [Penicillium manginii]KAJ5761591.1 hypothetical protein N7533_003630 [Penicillium manginii]
MATTGIFVDVVGLSYSSEGIKGTTSAEFEYSYNPGAQVTFSIGEIVLGQCKGRAITTISDVIPNGVSIYHPRSVNLAHGCCSVCPLGRVSKIQFALTITYVSGSIAFDFSTDDSNLLTHLWQVQAVINQHKDEINLDSDNYDDLDRPLNKICDILGLRPKSVHHTRNHLRREIAGFKVLRDFQIPSQDGGYVLVDFYLPLQPKGRFPVLLSCTIYGRRVPWGGPDLNDDEEIVAFERAEDEWHSTGVDTDLQIPDRGPWSTYFRTQRGFESIASFNTFSYVPKGYAMVKMDPKGVSETPGKRWEPGQLAGDFYTVCEWCADQPWSNGNVALVGNSYGANTQWAVAGLRPKGLKCFVPYAS